MDRNLDDRAVELKGSHLKGLRIDMIVSGGIACIESPRLVRELRRYGADVRVVMTRSATEFIAPRVFEWASGNPVVQDLTGSAEHITQADAILVAPCTFDFLTKMSVGIADQAAATLVHTALGRVPVLVVPSMHLSLMQNPHYEPNILALRKIKNVKILPFLEAEGKAKMLNIESIAAWTCHLLSKSSLKEKNVLVTGGATRSKVDEMRFLSNRSTGALGIQIADEAFRRGAEVDLVLGIAQMVAPDYFRVHRVETNAEMKTAVQKILQKKPSIGIFSAAVLDFDVAFPKKGKVNSANPWTIQMKTAEKLIDSFKAPQMLKVGFKLEAGLSEKGIQELAGAWAKKKHCDLVVANRFEDISNKKHRAFLIDQSSQLVTEAQSKSEIATKILDWAESKVLRPGKTRRLSSVV